MEKHKSTFVIQSDISLDDITSHLSKGLSLDLADSGGRTLLMQAVIDRALNIAEFLIKMGANINLRDIRLWTALHFAVQNGDLQMTKLLVENGAEVNASDVAGNSVLARAVFSSKGKGDVIKYLLRHDADINQANNFGITPIGLARSISNYDLAQYFQA